jgi:hypothetical protein
MNYSILNAFLADQRKAKEIVSVKLNVPQDIHALDWALHRGEVQAAYDTCPFADVFRPHGYGLELKIGDLYIDYDYSETGRVDGFDAWRIFIYITTGQFDNNGPDIHISDRIDQWFQHLFDTGRIVRLDNLYYITPAVPNVA